MARDLVLVVAFLTLVVLGVSAPFVFGLGYVWVDTFYPQLISYAALRPVPVALVMAIGALGGYVLIDRRMPPRFGVVAFTTLLLALWMTLSLSWALVPSAPVKWDWASKTVLFSLFIPFVFRTQVQTEAFLQVFLISALQAILPTAVKFLLTGGGYGQQLAVVQSNSGLSESSYLAAVSIAMIPIVLHLRDHSVLVPAGRARWWIYTGFVPLLIACAVGTYARTALVGFVVVGVVQFLRTRRKVAFVLASLVLVACMYEATAQKWEARIKTTADYQSETSSLGRILVWSWTLGFVSDHPFGGGFNAYQIDTITFPAVDGQEPVVVHGKAFHNVYIEVLGELGFPGLALYLTVLGATLLSNHRLTRRLRGVPALTWVSSLSGAMTVSLLTMALCGVFIGIAFQAFGWYLFGLSAALANHARRALSGNIATGIETTVASRWQAERGGAGLIQPAFPAGLARVARRSTLLVKPISTWRSAAPK